MFLVVFVVLILFLYVLDKILVDERRLELSERFGGPKRWPIFGNVGLFLGVGTDGNFKLIGSFIQFFNP